MFICLFIINKIPKVKVVSRMKCVLFVDIFQRRQEENPLQPPQRIRLTVKSFSPENLCVFNSQEMNPLRARFYFYKEKFSCKSNSRSYKCLPYRATLKKKYFEMKNFGGAKGWWNTHNVRVPPKMITTKSDLCRVISERNLFSEEEC